MERRGLKYDVVEKGHIEKMDGAVSYEAFALDIMQNETKVGYFQVRHYTKPCNFYMPYFIETLSGHKGERIGSSMLDNFNDFLIERGGIGILKDEIFKNDNDKRVSGMYERHGWKSLFPATDHKFGYLYFLPEGLPDEKLEELREAVREIP